MLRTRTKSRALLAILIEAGGTRAGRPQERPLQRWWPLSGGIYAL